MENIMNTLDVKTQLRHANQAIEELTKENKELKAKINLSLAKEIKTRKTNHMTALRKYQAGSEEAVNLKARISECQQIISIINDLKS